MGLFSSCDTGSFKLRYNLLNEVYQELRHSMVARMEAAQYITLTSDFWTNSMRRGVFGCIAVLQDRSSYVLQALDVSDSSHTAAFIRGVSMVAAALAFAPCYIHVVASDIHCCIFH